MYLYMIIYVGSLTKRQLGVSLWAIMRIEKDGDVVILQLANAMSHEILYLMINHHGGY